MYVQPYFPEQIEIKGNIASEPYDVRLGFIRRTVALHTLTVLLVAAVAWFVPSPLSMRTALATFFAILVSLSIIRLISHRGRVDIIFSGILLPALLVILGWVLRLAFDVGWPSWCLGFAVLGGALYTLVCGRDFSFVGQYFIAAIIALVGIAVVAWLLRPGGLVLANAAVFTLAFLGYYVYDLAALLTRRKKGEELGAVTDLYRDVLNGFTYIGRVVQHWRRFRI